MRVKARMYTVNGGGLTQCFCQPLEFSSVDVSSVFFFFSFFDFLSDFSSSTDLTHLVQGFRIWV